MNKNKTVGLPSRAQLKEQLIKLIEGKISTQDISNWASQWLALEDKLSESDDLVVFSALAWLSGADITNSGNSDLHGQKNFIAWLKEFEEECARKPIKE